MTSTETFNPGVIPCGHRLVVYPIPVERKTASGIILHDISANREDMAQIEARVVVIGPNCWHDQPGQRAWCKVGDKVLIAKYSGLFWNGHDDRAYRVISDLDVIAIVKEKNDE